MRKTRGDRLFDRWVYGVMNGLGTFALTIPTAYEAEHGIGKPLFEKARTWLVEKRHLSPNNAADILLTCTLFLGGTLMVIPVRIAEAYRTQIVDRLNRGTPDEHKPGDPPRPELPLQTWGSLIKGRLVSWGIVFSSFKAVGYLSGLADRPSALGDFKHWFSETLVCKPLDEKLYTLPAEEVAALRASGTEAALETLKHAETKTYRLGKLAALDVFATAAAASILYTTSRFFARTRSPEKEAELRAKAHGGHVIAADAVLADAAPDAPRIAAAPQPAVGGEKLHAGVLAPQALEQGVRA